MSSWENIQIKEEAEFVLNEIMLKEYIEDKKVKRVFSLNGVSWGTDNQNILKYTFDDNIYIQFEDDNCLVINSLFESSLYVDFRKLNSLELEIFDKLPDDMKDLFNTTHEIHDCKFINGELKDYGIKEIEKISFYYDSIVEFKVNGFNHEYYKWVHGKNNSHMITILEGGHYFDDIEIVLKNGGSIWIKPYEAIDDGECDVYCEGIDVMNFEIEKIIM